MLVKFIPGLRVTPHVRPAVRRRDVQQADSLQGRTVRQIQRNSVALGKKRRSPNWHFFVSKVLSFRRKLSRDNLLV
jgi:hypothetical protein